MRLDGLPGDTLMQWKPVVALGASYQLGGLNDDLLLHGFVSLLQMMCALRLKT